MDLVVRACNGADEAAVESLPAPDSSTRRKLFGLTHAGALIETSQVTLCAEQPPPNGATTSATANASDDPSAAANAALAGFASFDDQIPAALARWPEVRDYLKKRLLFGKPNGCLMLVAFRYDPEVATERKVLAALLHQLFQIQPELGGVVSAVHVGVDVEELGVFSQTFSCYDAVGLSSGGLLMFYRAVRADYSPSVFVRRPLSSEAETDQLLAMVRKNEDQKRHAADACFDAAADPARLLANQDEHRACFVAQCVDTQQPCGLLACTDSINTDQVDGYARLFSDIYRRANPIPEEPPTAIASSTPAADSASMLPPPAVTSSSIAPAPAPTPLQASNPRSLHRPVGGPPNIILLGPTGSGKSTQSTKLVEEFGVVYVSAGNLLREAASDSSGKYADITRLMNAGDLVPDDVVQDMVLSRLLQPDCKARGWLLEGFPRTDTQARVFISHGAKPDVVAILELSDDDASQRDGDGEGEAKAEASSAPVGRRLAVYREHREAVRQNFVKISTVIHVDAAKSRDTTTKKLVHEIYRARGSRGPLRLRNPPRLIITGAPASGKGTQCELIVRALHVVHLSTGDMLRQAIRDGTSLGKQAQEYMDEGQLVPDELIVGVVLERLAQPDCKARGWLLDGFPRTEAQAQALLATRTIPDCVLALDVPDDEVVKRIAGRRLDPETGKTYHITFNPPPPDVADRVIQRSDDTEETVRTRLEQFHAHSKAIVTALGGVCELIQADGTRPVDQVAEQLQHDTENNAASNKKAKHNKHEEAKLSILYAFHRDELPFLLNVTLDLSINDELHHGQVEPVIVKGMGVKGFGLTVRSWTHKCFELLGLGGKKEKKAKSQKSRSRAVTSETGAAGNNISSDSHATDAGRNTIH
ncbi:unnamed protein product [Phytophthora fragariaefolia]|uniref:Unnamed protein product n=1 Tax=Phytophthora fragariaefolia TaxID=1490495 RepID=A0A9W6WZF0_9STRA|nr:unnamed protein product [Phytophthora fragariaefolia]